MVSRQFFRLPKELANPEVINFLSSLLAHIQDAYTLSWKEVREDFIAWLNSRNLDPEYRQSIISNLDRFAPKISSPIDVSKLFSGLSRGQRHCLLYSIRNLFNFAELAGFPEFWIQKLRKALPKDSIGVDNYVPSENEIECSIRKLRRIPLKYQALYNLLLDSGLRLREAIYLINNFQRLHDRLEIHEKFVCIPLFLLRRSKKSFYAYFLHETLDLIRNNEAKLKPNASSHEFRKHGMVPAKYVRKFVFDKMIELDVPEAVADFIQGRAPTTVGRKHYMALKRQADRNYPKYANYIRRLKGGS